MKSWSCGLVRRIGTADSATPLLRPSGGQAPVLHFLEGSDHSHLGQILTYLAGLEAKTIIWIAREFDDAHRSAVKKKMTEWLHEACRVRVELLKSGTEEA